VSETELKGLRKAISVMTNFTTLADLFFFAGQRALKFFYLFRSSRHYASQLCVSLHQGRGEPWKYFLAISNPAWGATMQTINLMLRSKIGHYMSYEQ